MAALRVGGGSLFLEQLFSVVRFPMWWYSRGLEELIAWCATGLRTHWRNLQLGLWARSLFRPMYGVQDVWGRAISFVMRTFVMIGRCFSWFIEAIAYGILLLLWCLWPIACLLLLVWPFV